MIFLSNFRFKMCVKIKEKYLYFNEGKRKLTSINLDLYRNEILDLIKNRNSNNYRVFIYHQKHFSRYFIVCNGKIFYIFKRYQIEINDNIINELIKYYGINKDGVIIKISIFVILILICYLLNT